nr:hypothetical protein [Alphaproteobacteria bacterium]
MMNVFDQILASALMTIRQPVESYIELETAFDEKTLATRDGSLVSYIKVMGARQIIRDGEYRWLID